MKKVAILQSNYIPWKGYFDLIAAVDEFILYDDMQYTKNDWRNRNRIKTPDGLKWITIPIGDKIKYRIRDVELVNNGWNINHWKMIHSNYARANYFKEVKFNFSIDAVGTKNDYIRYPSKWADVVSNLERLDDTPSNITVNIACAVQLLNVLSIQDLVYWKESMNFKKINLPPYGAGLVGTHLVYLPSYLNVRVLPQYLKDRVATTVEKFCASRINDIEFMSNPYGATRWRCLVQYMNQEDWSHKIPILLDYLETTDQTRGTNFRQVFPELSL
jgi:hypothetical protein